MEPFDRPAARALLLTPASEVLLMQLEIEPGRRVWVAPGGGLDENESPLDGVVREVFEETGRRITPGPPVWTRTHTFELQGRQVRQIETYFLTRVEPFEPETSGFEEAERDWFRSYRWWSVDAICSSDETFAPRDLGALLKDLIQRGAPALPIDAGI